MKYILITLNPEDETELSREEYRSLLQMSKDLQTTYCSVYHNFLIHENPDVKQPVKRSQLKFNKQYKIISA